MQDAIKWWRESRFGLFIHFGIYAAAEGMWKGEEVKGLVEWMQCRKQIPVCEYKQLAKKLTLDNFDAKKYVEVAKAAGMKYVVFTAKHHDGFAMYNSKYSNYNVVKMCPSNRDPARELADEVHKAGLKMCFYYSQALDWEDENAFGNNWDFEEEEKEYRKFMDGKCKAQLKELLTNYGEVGLIWFDMPKGMSKEESYELKDYVKSLQPDCLVSGRIHMEQTVGDYGSMGDNEFPSGKLGGDWETPATLNNTWGYRKLDTNWKQPEELIRLLIELLGKGMNYLLNIGPMANGEIPKQSIEILEKVGAWVNQNQEAVYGTEETPFACDFQWGRIATKGNLLYLYLFKHEKSLQIPGIFNKVISANLIMKDGYKEIGFLQVKEQQENVLSLEIPNSDNEYFDVIRLELDDKPDVLQGVFQQIDGTIHLYAHMAQLKGTGKCNEIEQLDSFGVDVQAEKNNLWVEDNICIDPNGNIINWFHVEDYATWEFLANEPGVYRIQLQTRAVKYSPWIGGHTVMVEYDGQEVESVINTGEKVHNAHEHYFDERLSDIGLLQIDKAGKQKLILRLLKCNEEEKAGLLVTKILLTKKEV